MTLLKRWAPYATVYLRLALGASLLAALPTHLGLWGPSANHLQPWRAFELYLSFLPSLPPPWLQLCGWSLVLLQAVLGLSLLLGVWIRLASLITGLLFLGFALAATLLVHPKVALDYSFFTVSAGSFLLAAQGDPDAQRPLPFISRDG